MIISSIISFYENDGKSNSLIIIIMMNIQDIGFQTTIQDTTLEFSLNICLLLR
jgi:hypothetical protein